MKKNLKIIALLLVFALVFTACGGNTTPSSESDTGNEATSGEDDSTASGDDATDADSDLSFPDKVTHDGEPLPAGEGVFKVGLVMGSPFKGIFSNVLYKGADDSTIMTPTMWGTFMSDGEFRIREGGPVKFTPDKDAKTVTLEIVKDFRWSDGTPVTSKDFAYAYEIIAHGDYTGSRFTADYKNVVGAEEYYWGTMSEDTLEQLKSGSDDFKLPEIEPATEIAGLNIVDEKTLVITFKEFGVGMLWGAGVPYEPVPYEQLKDIPVLTLEESDAIRVNPLSCGPYYISNIVPGEQVEFTANEHFWNGKANIPKVLMQVISPDKQVASMKAGEFDYYTGLASSKYLDIKDLENYTILGRTGLSYNYLGFKLGKWDAAQSKNIYDPESKMANINLRKAMQKSIDLKGLSETYLNGLQYQGTTVIPTPFKSFHAADLKPIELDMEAAVQLLDEAGYKDTDSDGFREDPNGEALVIKMAFMSGSDINQKLADYYMQQWHEIGLNVELTNGRLLEFNNFYDLVQGDSEEIDIFFGGWGTGTNPECYGLYGEEATWNFTRYANPEFEAMLKKLSSEEAFDDDFRKQAYYDVQKYIYDNVPIAVTFYGYSLRPINKRVKFYDFSYDDGTAEFWSWADLQLTADEPIK